MSQRQHQPKAHGMQYSFGQPATYQPANNTQLFAPKAPARSSVNIYNPQIGAVQKQDTSPMRIETKQQPLPKTLSTQPQQSSNKYLKQASKYEAMAQKFSLETLIKQAHQKHRVPQQIISADPSSSQSMQVHFDQHTRFEHFEGDNDLVEEELDSNGSPVLGSGFGSAEFLPNVLEPSTPQSNLQDNAVQSMSGLDRFTLGTNNQAIQMTDSKIVSAEMENPFSFSEAKMHDDDQDQVIQEINHNKDPCFIDSPIKDIPVIIDTEMTQRQQQVDLKIVIEQKPKPSKDQASITIQRWVRGYLERLHMQKMKVNFRFMRKLRRILALRYYRLRSKFLQQLVNAMKAAHGSLKTQEDEMYQKYLNHCVLTIQKTWRGYFMREYIRPKLIRELRAYKILSAAVKGWKVRKIMSSTREVINIKREMAEIGFEMRRVLMQQNSQQQSRELKQLKVRKGKQVEELSRMIQHLYLKGRWVYSQTKFLQSSQYHHPKSGSNSTQNTRKSNILTSTPNTKQSFDPLPQQSQPTFKLNFHPHENTSRQIDFEQYMQSSTNEQRIIKQSPAKKEHVIYVQEEQPQVLWPSAKQIVVQEDEIASFWPSAQRKHQKASPINTDQLQLDDIPNTQRTAVGDKLRVLDSQNEYKQLIQEQSFPSSSQNLDDDERPIKAAKQILNVDDIPIKPQMNNQQVFDIDEMPIKPSKSIAEKKPIKKNTVSKDVTPTFTFNTNQPSEQMDPDSEIVPPKYNFEDMIEQALGQDVSKSPSKQPMISKTLRQEGEEDRVTPDKNPQKVVAKKKNTENLKKRQKYDPRKAIEEAKKKQEEAFEEIPKSAFPEGLLKPNAKQEERKRSMTSQPKTDNDYVSKLNGADSKKNKEQEEVKSDPQVIANNEGQPKSFLKRKKNQAVIQGKVTWKVESKIDCWVKDKSSKQGKTSSMRSPRSVMPMPISNATQLALQTMKQDVMQPQQQYLQQPQPRNQGKSPRRTSSNQESVPRVHVSLIQKQSFSSNNQQIGQGQKLNSDQMYPKQLVTTVEDHMEMESIPDENDNQYEDYDPTIETPILTEHIDNQNEQPPQTLQLDELEKVFEMFHLQNSQQYNGKLLPMQNLGASFKSSQILERPGTSIIPRLTTNSMFFQCYSDDIYDTILEDLREHYNQLCNE